MFLTIDAEMSWRNKLSLTVLNAGWCCRSKRSPMLDNELTQPVEIYQMVISLTKFAFVIVFNTMMDVLN